MESEVLFGLLFVACVFALFLVFMLYHIRMNRWLKQHGTPVTARVTRIKPGNSNAIVTAEWTDFRTSRTYTFDGVTIQPTLTEGALVSVRIDPRNPRRHLMDL